MRASTWTPCGTCPRWPPRWRRRGYQVDGSPWDELLGQLFANEVEPRLARTRPVILYDYPLAMAGLARRGARSTLRRAIRVLYRGAGTGQRLLGAGRRGASKPRGCAPIRLSGGGMGKKQYAVDADFLAALRVGMPPAGGIAVGVDRLIMLFADAASIHDTLWMPGRELFGPATLEE